MRTAVFHQRTLLALVLICTLLFLGCSDRADGDRPVTVVFRYDDYSALSPTAMELRIIDKFRSLDASLTIAAIPFVCAGDFDDPEPQDLVPLTTMKGNILRAGANDGTVDIALHGYSHQAFTTKPFSEFLGVDYAIAVDRISKGRKLLESMLDAPISSFIPPWNQYDLETLRALESLGFVNLSADKRGVATQTSILKFLPFSSTLTQVRDAVEVARDSSDKQPIIVVMFHPYNFREIDKDRGFITFPEFADLLDWLAAQEDVSLLSLSQATEVVDDLSARRFLSTQRSFLLNKMLPSSLSEHTFDVLYPESSGLMKISIELFGSLLLIMLIVAVVIIMAGVSVYRIGGRGFGKGVVISILVSAFMIFYTFRDGQAYWVGMVVCAGTIGSSIGLFVCWHYVKKRGR